MTNKILRKMLIKRGNYAEEDVKDLDIVIVLIQLLRIFTINVPEGFYDKPMRKPSFLTKKLVLWRFLSICRWNIWRAKLDQFLHGRA